MEGEKGMKAGGGNKRAGCGRQTGRQGKLPLFPSPSLLFFFFFFLSFSPLCPHLHIVWFNERAQRMHYPHNYIYNHYCTVRLAGACSCKHPHSVFAFHNTHTHTHTHTHTYTQTHTYTLWCQKSPHPRSDTGAHQQMLQTQ